nr:MAG: polyprotein [Diplodia seriata endornavirus 1]
MTHNTSNDNYTHSNNGQAWPDQSIVNYRANNQTTHQSERAEIHQPNQPAFSLLSLFSGPRRAQPPIDEEPDQVTFTGRALRARPAGWHPAVASGDIELNIPPLPRFDPTQHPTWTTSSNNDRLKPSLSWLDHDPTGPMIDGYQLTSIGFVALERMGMKLRTNSLYLGDYIDEEYEFILMPETRYEHPGVVAAFGNLGRDTITETFNRNRMYLRALEDVCGCPLASLNQRAAYLTMLHESGYDLITFLSYFSTWPQEMVHLHIAIWLSGFIIDFDHTILMQLKLSCINRIDPVFRHVIMAHSGAEVAAEMSKHQITAVDGKQLSTEQVCVSGVWLTLGHIEARSGAKFTIEQINDCDAVDGKDANLRKRMEDMMLGDTKDALRGFTAKGALDHHNKKIIDSTIRLNTLHTYPIPLNTSTSVVEALELSWPRKTFVTSTQCDDHPHIYLNVSRNLCREWIVSQFPRNQLLIDAGGDFYQHIKSSNWNVHTCFKDASAHDHERFLKMETKLMKYIQTTSDMVATQNGVKSLSEDRVKGLNRIRRGRQQYYHIADAENCVSRGHNGWSFGMSVDALFYISPEKYAKIMKAHNIVHSIHAITVPPTFMYAKSGKLPFNEGAWLVKDDVFSMTTNGESHVYSSSYKLLLKWLTTPLYAGDGFGMYVRNEGYKGAHMILRVTRVPLNVLQAVTLRHCVWLSGDADSFFYDVPLIKPNRHITALWRQPFETKRIRVNMTLLEMLQSRLRIEGCTDQDLHEYARGLKWTVYTSNTGRTRQFDLSDAEMQDHELLAIHQHTQMVETMKPLFTWARTPKRQESWLSQVWIAFRNVLLKLGRQVDPTEEDWVQELIMGNSTADEYKLGPSHINEMLHDITQYEGLAHQIESRIPAAITYHNRNQIKVSWKDQKMDRLSLVIQDDDMSNRIHAHHHKHTKQLTDKSCKPNPSCPHEHDTLDEHDLRRPDLPMGMCSCCGIESSLYGHLCDVCRRLQLCLTASRDCPHTHIIESEHCCAQRKCACKREQTCSCCGCASTSNPCLLCLEPTQPAVVTKAMPQRAQQEQMVEEINTRLSSATSQHSSEGIEIIDNTLSADDPLPPAEQEQVAKGTIQLMRHNFKFTKELTTIQSAKIEFYDEVPGNGDCGWLAVQSLFDLPNSDLARLKNLTRKTEWWGSQELGLFATVLGLNLLIKAGTQTTYHQGNILSQMYGSIIHMHDINGTAHWNPAMVTIIEPQVSEGKARAVSESLEDFIEPGADMNDVSVRAEAAERMLSTRSWMAAWPALSLLQNYPNRIIDQNTLTIPLEPMASTPLTRFISSQSTLKTRSALDSALVRQTRAHGPSDLIWFPRRLITIVGPNQREYVIKDFSVDGLLKLVSSKLNVTFYNDPTSLQVNQAMWICPTKAEAEDVANERELQVVPSGRTTGEACATYGDPIDVSHPHKVVVIGLSAETRMLNRRAAIDHNGTGMFNVTMRRPNLLAAWDWISSLSAIGVEHIYMPAPLNNFDLDDYDQLKVMEPTERVTNPRLSAMMSDMSKRPEKNFGQNTRNQPIGEIIETIRKGATPIDADDDVRNWVLDKGSPSVKHVTSRGGLVSLCRVCHKPMLTLQPKQACTRCNGRVNCAINEPDHLNGLMVNQDVITDTPRTEVLDMTMKSNLGSSGANRSIACALWERWLTVTNALIRHTTRQMGHRQALYVRKHSASIKSNTIAKPPNFKPCSDGEPVVILSPSTWCWAYTERGTIVSTVNMPDGPIDIIAHVHNVSHCPKMIAHAADGIDRKLDDLKEMLANSQVIIGVPGAGKTRKALHDNPGMPLITMQTDHIEVLQAAGHVAYTPSTALNKHMPETVIIDELGKWSILDLWPFVNRVKRFIGTADLKQTGAVITESKHLRLSADWLDMIPIASELTHSRRFGSKTAKMLKAFHQDISGSNESDNGIDVVLVNQNDIREFAQSMIGREVNRVITMNNRTLKMVQEATDLPVSTVDRTQGMTIPKTAVVIMSHDLPDCTDERLYTALSRHTDGCTLMLAKDAQDNITRRLNPDVAGLSPLISEMMNWVEGPVAVTIKIGKKITIKLRNLVKAICSCLHDWAKQIWSWLQMILGDYMPIAYRADTDEIVISEDDNLQYEIADGLGLAFDDGETPDLKLVEPTPLIEQEEVDVASTTSMESDRLVVKHPKPAEVETESEQEDDVSSVIWENHSNSDIGGRNDLAHTMVKRVRAVMQAILNWIRRVIDAIKGGYKRVGNAIHHIKTNHTQHIDVDQAPTMADFNPENIETRFRPISDRRSWATAMNDINQELRDALKNPEDGDSQPTSPSEVRRNSKMRASITQANDVEVINAPSHVLNRELGSKYVRDWNNKILKYDNTFVWDDLILNMQPTTVKRYDWPALEMQVPMMPTIRVMRVHESIQNNEGVYAIGIRNTWFLLARSKEGDTMEMFAQSGYSAMRMPALNTLMALLRRRIGGGRNHIMDILLQLADSLSRWLKIRLTYWKWYSRCLVDASYKQMPSTRVKMGRHREIATWLYSRPNVQNLVKTGRLKLVTSAGDCMAVIYGVSRKRKHGLRESHLMRFRQTEVVGECIVDEIGDRIPTSWVTDAVKQIVMPSFLERHGRSNSMPHLGGKNEILSKYWSRWLGMPSRAPITIDPTWKDVKYNMAFDATAQPKRMTNAFTHVNKDPTIKDTPHIVDVDYFHDPSVVAVCIPSGAGKTVMTGKNPTLMKDVDDLMNWPDFAQLQTLDVNAGMFMLTDQYRRKIAEWLKTDHEQRILLVHHPDFVSGLVKDILVVEPTWDLAKPWSRKNLQALASSHKNLDRIRPRNHGSMERQVKEWADTRLVLLLKARYNDNNEIDATAEDWFTNRDQSLFSEVKLPSEGRIKHRLPIMQQVRQNITVIGHAPTIARPVVHKYGNQLMNSITTRLHGVENLRKNRIDPEDNLESMAEAFFVPDWRELLIKYEENPVYPSAEMTEEWLSMKGDANRVVKEMREVVKALYTTKPFSDTKLHLKSEVLLKEQVDKFEDQIGRVIVWHPKYYCAIISPIINILKSRFKALLDPSKCVYSDGLTVTDLQGVVSDLTPKEVIEMDMKKQDRQTDQGEIENEELIMIKLGFPKFMMEKWHSYNSDWRYVSGSGIRARRNWFRKTGDEMTSLGNAIKNLSGLAAPFIKFGAERVLVLGDDSIAFGPTQWDQRWVEDHMAQNHNVRVEWAGGSQGKFCQFIISPIRNHGFIVAADFHRLNDKYRAYKSMMERGSEDWNMRAYSYLCLVGKSHDTMMATSRMGLPRPIDWSRAYWLRAQANANYHGVSRDRVDGWVSAMIHDMEHSTIRHQTFKVLGAKQR